MGHSGIRKSISGRRIASVQKIDALERFQLAIDLEPD